MSLRLRRGVLNLSFSKTVPAVVQRDEGKSNRQDEEASRRVRMKYQALAKRDGSLLIERRGYSCSLYSFIEQKRASALGAGIDR
jgi:hypothetical protein